MKEWNKVDDAPSEFRGLIEEVFDAMDSLWEIRGEMSEPRHETLMVRGDDEALIVYAPGEHQQAIIDFVESLEWS